MTLIEAPFPTLQTCIASIRGRFVAAFRDPSTSGETFEESRNRREFIHEMLNRNPDAFKGEMDVQSMMQMYPGHF